MHIKYAHIIYQCLMVLAIIKKQVMTWMITQKVFKNKAIRSSRRVRIGTSGLSSSVCPIRCPVARAQMRSNEFTQIDPHSIHDDLHGMPYCSVSHAPLDMKNVATKIASTGNERIMLCERGYTHGYNNLVVDMRSLPIMASTGYPVVFDASCSTQFCLIAFVNVS